MYVRLGAAAARMRSQRVAQKKSPAARRSAVRARLPLRTPHHAAVHRPRGAGAAKPRPHAQSARSTRLRTTRAGQACTRVSHMQRARQDSRRVGAGARRRGLGEGGGKRTGGGEGGGDGGGIGADGNGGGALLPAARTRVSMGSRARRGAGHAGSGHMRGRTHLTSPRPLSQPAAAPAAVMRLAWPSPPALNIGLAP